MRTRPHTCPLLPRLGMVIALGAMLCLTAMTSTLSAQAVAAPATLAAPHHAGVAPAPAGAPAVAQPDPGGAASRDESLMLVLDTSGSMNDDDGTGTIKIDGAKGAVLDVITAASGAGEFGLLTYPDTKANAVDRCQPGKVRVQLGALNVGAAMHATREVDTDGDTPTSNALRQAAAMLTARGHTNGTIVLVSDGEANCGPPPCDVAKELVTSGKNVVVNTVGFQLTSEQGSADLRCIAETTGGTNVSVHDTAALIQAIKNASEPTFTLAHNMPSVVPTVTGTTTVTVGGPQISGTTVSVEVTNVSAVVAKDTRITLVFSGTTGTPGETPTNIGAIQTVPPARYLGNLSPGQKRTVEFLIRPTEYFGSAEWALSVMAASGNALRVTGKLQVDSSLDREALGPVLREAKRVAVVGDSYSSGEGTGDYLKGSAGAAPNTHCHQSRNTYAGQIWGDKATIIACSGAITTDFTQQQKSGESWVPPQLQQLRSLALSQDSPDAVLLTIGGNDVQFAPIVTDCVVMYRCRNWDLTGSIFDPRTVGTDRKQKAMAIEANLVKVYQAVDRAVNDPAALAERNGKVAPIVVLPYVRSIPATNETKYLESGCMFGISREEAQWLNEFLGVLNTSVSLAVSQLAREGRPVYYVSDVIEAFQPSHTICDANGGYANIVSLAEFRRNHPHGLREALAAGNFLIRLNEETRNELGHPTTDGHNAIARAIVGWSQRVSVREAQPAPEWSGEWVKRPTAVEKWARGTAQFFGIVPGNGDSVELSADGFQPNGEVVFWYESVPLVAGHARADATGRASATVAIPADLATGDHTLVAYGFAPDGTFRETRQPFSVGATGATPTLLAGLCGTVVLLHAGLLWCLAVWRSRRVRG